MAYQGYGRGLDQNLITQLNTIATGGVRSDLTLWLDLDVAIGLGRAKERGKRDRIEEADFTFHQRVHQGFAALAKQEPNRVVRIDASRSKVEVTGDIIKALEDRFISWIQPSNPLGSEIRSVSQLQSDESFQRVKVC
jgi:dTMP kinase